MAKKPIPEDMEADARVRHTPRMTEHKSGYVMADERLREQFRDNEQIVFRAELELLMGEYKRHEIAYAVNRDYVTGVEAKYVGEFVEQNHDLIVLELQKRLRLPIGQIEAYLTNVSNAMRASFANQEVINPYTGESVGVTATAFLKAAKPKRRGKSKEKKKPKQGRKKPVLGFESIKAASKATGESYDYLRRLAEKEHNGI